MAGTAAIRHRLARNPRTFKQQCQRVGKKLRLTCAGCRAEGRKPIALHGLVALDQFVLWDNTTGPNTVKGFIDAAKAAASPFKMGGTGSKREDHVLTMFIEQKTGARFSYLPYKSGGEAATQLVGHHTESNVNNPSENLEVWRAGQVRPLCVFDKERISYKTKVTETQS